MIICEYISNQNKRIIEYRVAEKSLNIKEILELVYKYDELQFNSSKYNLLEEIQPKLTKFNDFEVELIDDEKLMWQKIGNTARNQINKIKRKDDYIYELLYQPSQEDIKEYIGLFYNALKAKGHYWNLDARRFYALIQNEEYMLSYLKNKKGDILAGHGYLLDKESGTAILDKSFISARDYFNDDTERFSNKMLHWLDFIALGKTITYKYYYMGGLGSCDNTDDEANRIAFYKEKLVKDVYKKHFIYFAGSIDCVKIRECINTMPDLNNSNIIIYGYGIWGISARLKYEESNRIVCVVDKNLGGTHEWCFEHLPKAQDGNIVLITSKSYQDDMIDECLKKGYSIENIICVFN